MLLCEVKNCSGEAHARGFCFKHYMRVMRSGTAESARDHRGSNRNHPLYVSWKSIHRTSLHNGGHSQRWDDFWSFVEDMGDRPEGYRLARLDNTRPYSKENCEWRAPILGGQKTKEERAAYARAFRLKNVDSFKSRYLQRAYGITLEQYNELFAAQGGVCAICRQKEINITKEGEPRMLAVDHDHKTGAIRGLLCTYCNTLIGLAGDSIDRLRAVIDYLRSHQTGTEP